MITIWKFIVPITDSPLVEMPYGALILSVALASPSEELYVWAVVDTRAAKVNRMLHVQGTGNQLPSSAGRFIGTVQDPPFVWHLFDGEEIVPWQTR